jgi:protease IV
MRWINRSKACIFALAAGSLVSMSAAAVGRDEPDAKPETRVGLIELEHALSEKPGELDWLFGGKGKHTLRDVVGVLRDAASDDGLDAVMIRLREAPLTTTQIEELGAAIERVRAAGKKVHLFSESYGAAELMLGSYADEVVMQDGGGVMLPGMHMEEMFLADTLAWAGVKADYVQVGDFKGASEQMSRSSPSPQWDQNINQLLDSLYGNLRGRIMAGRKMDDARLDAAMKESFLATSETAKKVGLVDATIDLPTLSDHLGGRYGQEIAWTNLIDEEENAMTLNASNPFAMLAKLTKEPDMTPRRETIAVVHIDGPIVDGESTAAGFMGEQSVGSTTVRRALSEIEDEDQIKGVVIRINSPGGSAIASEIIWRGVRRVAEKKPVWVSVGNMAASGGYYIASSGQKIFVNPSSIVGSIGVVGGKLAMGGLYEHLKVRVVPRSRGPMGGMLGSVASWTDEERSLVKRKMTETYDLFTKRVTQGRPGIDLSQTAEGRLFTGDRAVKNKMADEIGSLDDAISQLASATGLGEGEYDVMDFPGPRSLGDVIGEALGGFAGASAPTTGRGQGSILASTMREVVGDETFAAIRDPLAAMLQMREEPVLLVSPKVLIIRK